MQTKLISQTIPTWKPANLDGLNRRFEPMHPRQVIRHALTVYGDEAVMATGFGVTGVVMMHMVSEFRPKTTIFYLDTDLLFPETLALRDRLAERLGLTFTPVHSGLSLNEQAYQYGSSLWERTPDLCCRLRKVEPLRRFLADKRAWITGIRRDQGVTRTHTPVVAWDRVNNAMKFAPLATWTRRDVWQYIFKHQLPYNPLHDQGYPSLGCMTCTRSVHANGSERGGRWVGTGKAECGIHTIQ